MDPFLQRKCFFGFIFESCKFTMYEWPPWTIQFWRKEVLLHFVFYTERTIFKFNSFASSILLHFDPFSVPVQSYSFVNLTPFRMDSMTNSNPMQKCSFVFSVLQWNGPFSTSILLHIRFFCTLHFSRFLNKMVILHFQPCTSGLFGEFNSSSNVTWSSKYVQTLRENGKTYGCACRLVWLQRNQSMDAKESN